MKITIDIPKEFEQHFNNDRFRDSLKRIITDVTDEIESDFSISGKYEIELCEMLIKAFKNAEPVKCGKWIKGKYWDEWFCSVCRNGANIDSKENPILSDYCPDCGAEMKKGE